VIRQNVADTSLPAGYNIREWMEMETRFAWYTFTIKALHNRMDDWVGQGGKNGFCLHVLVKDMVCRGK